MSRLKWNSFTTLHLGLGKLFLGLLPLSEWAKIKWLFRWQCLGQFEVFQLLHFLLLSSFYHILCRDCWKYSMKPKANEINDWNKLITYRITVPQTSHVRSILIINSKRTKKQFNFIALGETEFLVCLSFELAIAIMNLLWETTDWFMFCYLHVLWNGISGKPVETTGRDGTTTQ